jgi:hypothetical protein
MAAFALRLLLLLWGVSEVLRLRGVLVPDPPPPPPPPEADTGWLPAEDSAPNKPPAGHTGKATCYHHGELKSRDSVHDRCALQNSRQSALCSQVELRGVHSGQPAAGLIVRAQTEMKTSFLYESHHWVLLQQVDCLLTLMAEAQSVTQACSWLPHIACTSVLSLCNRHSLYPVPCTLYADHACMHGL